MKNYESLNASQVAEIKSKYGLIESKVTSVTTLTEKEDVWDVSLLDKETEVPHSIFTNGIITHNSFQAEYFLAIARHVGAVPAKMPDSEAHQRIFGLQNNDGKWVVPPRIRYYPMSIGEKFFDYVARLMRQLPDKLSKEGKWWLVYDPENKLHKDYIKTKKPEYNEKYYKRTGKWWVETEHGLPQALIITDSYPAMNPEKMDVDDPSAAMAMQARMFSDNIKRIKGKMSAKRITVLGINQLRLRPGVSFGNPEYEPCFVGSTPILLKDGRTKTIEEIVKNKIAVSLPAYNLETGKVEIRPVVAWKENGTVEKDQLVTVQYSGGKKDGQFTSTKNHKILTGRGWIQAENLEIDDTLVSCEWNTKSTIDVKVTNVTFEPGDEKVQVYDLTVEDLHNYFIGGENSAKICVKNCGEALKFNCFSADTMLQTSKGLLYADELYFETREPKSKIPFIQGVKGFEKPPIYDFMGNSELIEVTTRGGFKLKGKPGHRVAAIKKGSFTPAWTSLNDIHIQASSSYYLPLQIGANVFNQEETIIDYSGKKLVGLGDSATNGMTVTLPSSSSVELAYLLGYFVAEGHSKDNCLILVNKDKELIDHVAYCYAKVFNLDKDEVFNRVLTKDDIYEFRVNDCAAAQLLTYVGLAQVASHEKHVPWIIRRGTKEEQIAFLSALFEGDGSLQNSNVSYFSLSDKLLSEVQQMLLNFGIYAKRSSPELEWQLFEESGVSGSLILTGTNAEKFISDIGFLFSRKQDKVLVDEAHSCNNLSDVIPKFLSWYHSVKFENYIEDLKGCNKYFRLENFEDGWYEDAVAYAEGSTNLDKVKIMACLNDLKTFIDYTRKHNLIWLEVEDIKFNFSKYPTFDANMPDTHTIITNGFVSHNSDVRIRMASRSVQGGSGQYEEEPSINGGVDQYRYIHMRAHKNKLSVPNLEGWARIWVKDSDGVAHGFDPVYDAFFFMKELGLISGTKNKLKISLKKFEGHKPISWLNFKKLILGNKKVITETLEIIGVKGYVNLRQELFDLFKDGKAMEIFFERKKSNLKDVEEDD